MVEVWVEGLLRITYMSKCFFFVHVAYKLFGVFQITIFTGPLVPNFWSTILSSLV